MHTGLPVPAGGTLEESGIASPKPLITSAASRFSALLVAMPLREAHGRMPRLGSVQPGRKLELSGPGRLLSKGLLGQG